VRPEQTEDHALRDLEIDPREGRRRAEPLDHAPDTDCGRLAPPRSVDLRLRQRGRAVRLALHVALPPGRRTRLSPYRYRQARHQGCTHDPWPRSRRVDCLTWNVGLRGT